MPMIGAGKIISNTIFLTLSSLFNLIVSLITTSIIARNLGPELYGKYTFGLAYILLFSVFANFGLESLFIREVARDKKNIDHMIVDIFHMKIFLALFTVLLVMTSVNFLGYPKSTITVIYILCVGLFFQILYEPVISVYKAFEKMSIVAIFRMGFRVVTAIIIILAIYFGMGLFGIVTAFSIGNAIVFMASVALFYRNFRIMHFKLNPRKWVILIKAGFPFYVSALLYMVYLKTNVLMLSKMIADREIGLYMAAATLVEGLYFIPDAFNMSIFPAFSRIYGDSFGALKITFEKTIKYLTIITAGITSGTLLIGDRIVLLIYGREFVASIPALKVLIFFWVFMFFSNTLSSLLFSIKKENLQVRITGLALLINIVLCYILINQHGFLGAAWAPVITEALTIGIITFVLRNCNLKYKPDLFLLRLIVVIIAMSIIVKLLMNANLLITISAGAFSYIFFLFFLRIFNKQEINYLLSAIKRH